VIKGPRYPPSAADQSGGGHRIERGWSTLSNGELLEGAEQEDYDLLITTAQNLRCQQHLATRPLAIMVLLSTSWPRIQRRIETVQAAVESIVAGGYQEIAI
jgi:hypothetical protein